MQAAYSALRPAVLRYTEQENPLGNMSLVVESLPCVLTNTPRARYQFLKRLFWKNDTNTDLYTWEHTCNQLCSADIPAAFLATNEKFVEFLNDPSRELFSEWSDTLEDTLDSSGVIDDWNASAVFMAILIAKYRDLNVPVYGPILPLENSEDVPDAQFADPTAGLCARSFATLVMAIAEAADKQPKMSSIAEDLFAEAEDGEEEDESE